MSITSKFIDLFTRKVVYNDNENYYCNGADNLYPQEVEGIINKSVTSKAAAQKLADFITGKGDAVNNDMIVNKKKNLTLLDIIRLSSKDIAYHNGFYLHIKYNLAGEVAELDVLPYKCVRKSKVDYNGYEGIFHYSKEWTIKKKSYTKRGKYDNNKVIELYPYNPNKDVIMHQMTADGGLNSYRGQVLFINLDKNSIYPTPFVDSVLFDAESEFRISQWRLENLRNGFIGKNIIVSQACDTEEENKAMEQNIQNFLGSENTGGVLHIPVENLDDIDKVIKVQTVATNIDDKMFELSEKSIRRNILLAFKNIPEALVNTGEGAVFSSSGEALNMMFDFYNEQTDNERAIIESVLNKLLNIDVNIIKLRSDASMQ